MQLQLLLVLVIASVFCVIKVFDSQNHQADEEEKAETIVLFPVVVSEPLDIVAPGLLEESVSGNNDYTCH